MSRARPLLILVIAIAALPFLIGLAPSTAEAAALECARRDGWQRWYSTPSKADTGGVWACGWYKSRSYEIEGTVWDTRPDDGKQARLLIRLPDGRTVTATGTSAGAAFPVVENPVYGSPPTLQECNDTACGSEVRVDYLPERNKLAGVFRVMTYNIHHGITDINAGWPGGKCSTIPPNSLGSVASTIRRNDPDILIVNEANRCTEDQPQKLAQALGMNVIYWNDWAGVDAEKDAGNAILSKYPMRNTDRFVLPFDAGRAPRVLISAEINVSGSMWVPVYGTHLALGRTDAERRTRKAQIDQVVARISERNHRPDAAPTIFGGDMNSDPSKDPGELTPMVSMGFNDAWRLRPNVTGYTYSSTNPYQRIDHIFTSPKLKNPCAGAAVPNSLSSDHLPVIADSYFVTPPAGACIG
ncbi:MULTISPECIES: endonuclease/exonuclease/phosphatase family protein [unclassified Nonomuraea]|uniref:endonuclease/exonuclease/phosphatase family protein n=1 Tax=unclassified Nonomuraea TaxID=2593643 RepID=UPI00340C5871